MSRTWRWAEAKAKGTSHARRGLPCQDHYRVLIQDGVLLCALADGAGSAPQGGLGASIAAHTSVRYLADHLGEASDSEQLMGDAARAAKSAVQAQAHRDGANVRDYATTLLALRVGADGGAALQVGDGLIACRGGNPGSWVPITLPQHGEYVNTTAFLTSSADCWCIEPIAEGNEIGSFALVSDGLEGLALVYADKSIHQPFFDGLISPLLGWRNQGLMVSLSWALVPFLMSDRVAARTDDDMSIILATRAVS